MELEGPEVRNLGKNSMRSYAARLAAVTMIAGLMSGIGASPASATHGATVCVIAAGVATLDTGLWLPNGPPNTAVVLSVTGGKCRDSADEDVAVVVGAVVSHTAHATHDHPDPRGVPPTHGGWCGHSHGTVTLTLDGVDHDATWDSAGTMLVLTGDVNGVVNAVVDFTLNPLPPATPTNSCTNGTAKVFLVTGVVVLPGPTTETTG